MGYYFDKIISDLKEDPFFAEFKFRKKNSIFYKESNGLKQFIELDHWQDFPPSSLEIYPMYNVRFDILHKWFERFSVRSLQAQRNDDSIGFDGSMLSEQNTFLINPAGSNYTQELESLRISIKKNAEYVFSQFSSLENLYDALIEPILKDTKEFPTDGADWIFINLALCKLEAPENYEKYKNKLVRHVEYMYRKGEPNIELIYDKLNEIFDYLETVDLEEETRRRIKIQDAKKVKPKRPKSIYRISEKEKFVEKVRKRIENEHNIRHSYWARWTIRAGYLFWIDYFFNPKENIIFYNLKVKPIYVDDLLWKIYGYKDKIKPFSIRIMGGDAVTSIPIYESKWIIDGDDGYSESRLITLFEEIYSDIEKNIDIFLKDNPDANDFYYYNKEWSDQTLPILMLCHQQKFHEALSMVNEEMTKGRTGRTDFHMPDGEKKSSYEFVKDYCIQHIDS